MNNTVLPTIKIDLVRSIITAVPSIRSFLQVLDRLTAKDVLHGVLHAILFHRLFGSIKPQTFEVLDVTMVSRDVLLNLIRLSIRSSLVCQILKPKS